MRLLKRLWSYLMNLILDVENTVTKRDGKLHLDPFEPDNKLVMVGTYHNTNNLITEEIHVFNHNEVDTSPSGHVALQDDLDRTDVLVCHNASHDLLWLWESGFTYEGKVWDTMLAEYVLQRGIKEPLSLEACAERHDLETKKQDTLKEYLKNGVGVDDIPYDMLSEYLSADLKATYQLYQLQIARLCDPDNVGLIDTVKLTNEVCYVLARIYQRGFKVDLNTLEEVREQFQQEKQTIERELQQVIRKVMGDTPINLNSPEQLSQVIFSRRVLDKQYWGNAIDPYMDMADFKSLIEGCTEKLYKTRAVQCSTCNGTGMIQKMKKDGTPYAKKNKCVNCNATGFLYEKTKERAGFKFVPRSPKWASANGFSTSKQNLELLETTARSNEMQEAEDFLSRVRRLSALDSYLSSFVDGISTYTKMDGKLHVRLLQHRTATGRFSGADPNMQNMPRGKTFPVKKVFVSRFSGGHILEADFAQLEFRVAAFLSQDERAIDEVTMGFDVHSYTAEVITNAGQPTDRQTAKAHTFAPLYGATGFGRTPAEARYYEHFTEKYKGIARWHESLASEAIRTTYVKLPSGREFSFPDVVRKTNGRVTNFTQLKNYPVQSFATADIVPLTLIEIEKRLHGMKSCIVNSVHDSIVIDVHPDERQQTIDVINSVSNDLNDLIYNRWNVIFNVPLLLESKIGQNWLDVLDVQ